MVTYRSFREVSCAYFKSHPEEIEPFLLEIFEDYAQDGDERALLSALHIIVRTLGEAAIAQAMDIPLQDLQALLAGQRPIRFDHLTAILQAMGYRLVPQRLRYFTPQS